jgi:hypothetical protein
MAAQQIGMTLRDASTAEQAELDHGGSFSGRWWTSGKATLGRPACIDKLCLYSQKTLLIKPLQSCFGDRKAYGERQN